MQKDHATRFRSHAQGGRDRPDLIPVDSYVGAEVGFLELDEQHRVVRAARGEIFNADGMFIGSRIDGWFAAPDNRYVREACDAALAGEGDQHLAALLGTGRMLRLHLYRIGGSTRLGVEFTVLDEGERRERWTHVLYELEAARLRGQGRSLEAISEEYLRLRGKVVVPREELRGLNQSGDHSNAITEQSSTDLPRKGKKVAMRVVLPLIFLATGLGWGAAEIKGEVIELLEDDLATVTRRAERAEEVMHIYWQALNTLIGKIEEYEQSD